MIKKKHSHFEVAIKDPRTILTFPGEEIRIAKRQHWLVLTQAFSITAAVSLLFIVAVYFLSLWIFGDVTFFVLSTLTILALGATVLVKAVIHWYFHFYVVTNHKLLEITYKPFFAEGMSDILLDLVRCTEIDIHTDGIINQIFNKGDVYITFDRPTHEEGFILRNIHSPRETGVLLSEMLTPQQSLPKNEKKHSWLKSKDDNTQYVYIEELIPQKG